MADPEQVVVASEPHRRLAYTWHSITPEFAELVGLSPEGREEMAKEARSTVSFEIEQAGELVRLTVVHGGFEPGSSIREGVGQGWPEIVSSLKTLLETGEPPAVKRSVADSVDQRLHALGGDLLDERRRARDADAVDEVVDGDVPAGGALRAERHPPGREQGVEQVGERRGVRQAELLGPAGQREPRRLPGQPQGDGYAARERGGRDRERLVAALGGRRPPRSP
ncbi:hypothetical protein GCM10020001_055350 [Nonomuraea salmonea]